MRKLENAVNIAGANGKSVVLQRDALDTRQRDHSGQVAPSTHLR